MRHVVFLLAVIFPMTGCVPPPQSLALQCVSGSAKWDPIVLDLAHPRVGGNPAVISDDAIRWQSTTRNGFGGATHTQYGISRSSGVVTVENTYVDASGISAVEPTNRYAGECYVRHRPF
jgi:hypothetical protein